MGDAAHRVTSGEPEGGAGGARLPVRAEPSSPPKQDRGQGSTTCRTPDVVEFGMSPFSWRRHSCLLGRDSSRPSSRAASAVPERREESRRRRHECLRHVLAQVSFPNHRTPDVLEFAVSHRKEWLSLFSPPGRKCGARSGGLKGRQHRTGGVRMHRPHREPESFLSSRPRRR
jgi:hypothetical protein